MRPVLGGQIIVITGAAGGIGQATARECSKRGAHLVLAGRSANALEQVRLSLTNPRSAFSVSTDVANLESVMALARLAVERFGRIDVWVNNAAVGMYGDFEDVPLADFRQVFETAFFGYVHGASAVLPIFRRQGRGTLINVASILGVIGIPHMSSYVAAKHAVVGFSECLRQELTGSAISVCTVLPATIDTSFYDNAANFTGRTVQPMPPVYSPEAVAKTIIRLSVRSQKQAFVPRSAALLMIFHSVALRLIETISKGLIDRFQIRGEPAAPTKGNLYEPRHTSIKPRVARLKFAGIATLGAAAALLLLRRSANS